MPINDRHAIFFIVSFWLLVVFVTGIGPNVAIDDSWNFAGPTKLLLDLGRLQFNPYNSAAAVPHVLWGALVCKVAGFSFQVCRFANLVVALGALLICFWMARQMKLSVTGAAVISLATAVSPPFFVTAFTYQSDFFYLIPAWAAVGFSLRYIHKQMPSDLYISALLVGLSVWNKSYGVLLIVSFLLFFLFFSRRISLRFRPMLSALCIATALTAMFFAVMPLVHPVRTTLDRKSAEMFARLTDPSIILTDGAFRLAVILLCLGMYALPVLLVGKLSTRRSSITKSKRFILLVLSLVLCSAAAIWLIGTRSQSFPFASSVLRELPALENPFILQIFTFASVIGAFFLLYHLLASLIENRRDGNTSTWFVAVVALPQVLVLIPILLFMDRYYLVFVPWAMMIALHGLEKRQESPKSGRLNAWLTRYGLGEMAVKYRQIALFSLAIIVLAGYLLVDVIRVWQYHNSIAVQWEAANELVAQGKNPANIDGGYSWFGWYNYPKCLDEKPNSFQPDPLNSHYVAELCPWADIHYDVVFHELPPPRQLIGMRKFNMPLLGEGQVLVYERLSPTQ